MSNFTMVVDLKEALQNIGEFPNGVYEAQILNAEGEISKNSGNPMIVLELELHHPQLGNAKIRDYLPYNHSGKNKAFWQAINDLSDEELRTSMSDETKIELDPEDLKGAQLLVYLGERAPDEQGRVFKQIDRPWYFAPSRTDLLEWQHEHEGVA